MTNNEEKLSWTVKLDWLNILSMLRLVSINKIPEFKREKAVRRVSKTYDIQTLMECEPETLDKFVVNELRDLMKKELLQNVKNQERIEKQMRNRFIPMKKGGIIRLDPRDLKDFKGDPEEMLKFFYKKFLGEGGDDDDKDDDREDNTGYYI
ncbi:hypothetical protein LCGC14_1622790 [marine sediment metagenome]|uniref:Uncharacterized protein n=1 Tax=marine sediment metagenome TaxID=412755 RepID=A0A0F9IS10_9ZZZZ